MSPHVRHAAAIVATLALLLCALAQAGGATATSGVRGLLRLSHGCPGPVREGDTRRCDYAGAGIFVRAFTLSGAALAGDRTDARGRFTIALPPGRYLLRAHVPKAKDQPQPVRVRPANWTLITLRYLVPPYME
jgi:hypothetical protein